MSRFTGKQAKGARFVHRAKKRAEAETRAANVRHDRTRAHRQRRGCSCSEAAS
jgi:hypothetical protein